jgi:hypothetical protein
MRKYLYSELDQTPWPNNPSISLYKKNTKRPTPNEKKPYNSIKGIFTQNTIYRFFIEK